MTTPSLINAFPRAAHGSASSHEADHSMVLRARNGDQKAITYLWDGYRRPIHNFFSRSVSNKDEAEDLTSETLLAAIHGLDRFRGTASSAESKDTSPDSEPLPTDPARFRAYLYGIANNKLRHWIRNKRTHGVPTSLDHSVRSSGEETSGEPLPQSDQASASDPLDAVLRQEHLDSACYALADVGMRSGEQFKALLLHYGCGLSHKDVAQLLNTRHETINTRLQEGRQTLKSHYQRTRKH